MGPSPYRRQELGALIAARLLDVQDSLQAGFTQPGQIRSCFVDDLLPEAIAHAVYAAFPDPTQMAERRSIREFKKVAAQMDQYNPLLEEIVFAFQEPQVVRLVEAITGIPDMEPDAQLYAGGISLMQKDNFLNPHLDNSHDNDRQRYRVLNLLYYVTPNWQPENGGNLELWDRGAGQPQRTIVSKFNRLVLMITNQTSIHSVSKVTADRSRCCVSNYYFSDRPADLPDDYFHVTSFYGRPDEPLKKVVLKADRNVRNLLRKIIGKPVHQTKHIYKKP
ncbi:MAG: 2OG-Fe(II) oxygenase [Sphingobacteriales bacterium]|nr:MAG: 2OG-Fe(II) oxygenase [Sphingobacteriales bacterium]